MKIVDIHALRCIQVDILRHFDSFCKENNLTYFLSNGTLLGAVKYQGFIPWDDDVDVCMPRQSFDKLLRIYDNGKHPGFRLYSLNDQQRYYFPFAKLADTKTILQEQGVVNPKGMGVNIDIFPLDSFGEDEKQARRIYHRMERLRMKLLYAKLNTFTGAPWKRLIKRCVAGFYAASHGNGRMHYCWTIERIAKSTKQDDLWGNVVWGFYRDGEAHKKSVFAQTVDVAFEGGVYPAPVGYDAYLRKLYGDYRKDPPVDKQVTHHNFTAYYKESL